MSRVNVPLAIAQNAIRLIQALADASSPPHAVDAQRSRENREETYSQVVA
jgi:hypothetical protein